ncbi:hypothetical protein GCM10010981_17860 [Dyella nitratireducens]|uniref:Uncharacterized protein n=1 Tax=Dyella nitratireducens TaxID=1849580 RepID=A0ABQ1FSJ6_9GAMM|nr:hypothetical protein GCM10010981_17860 [Dyella nitratireducens]GLQ43149.1 hypothetical protein GCM10007902_29990 [Dyella nitratireducens]
MIELASQRSRNIALICVDDVYDFAPPQSITVDANGIDVVSRRANGAVDAAGRRNPGSCMETVAITIGRSNDATMAVIQAQRVGVRRYLAACSAIRAAMLSGIATRTA